MDSDGMITALPGSSDPGTGRLRVTAFVTPRLNAGGGRVGLDQFADFADWGTVSAGIRLALEVDFPGLVDTLELEPDPASPLPDAGLWHALFDRVEVGDGGFQDLSGQAVASFPSAAVAELVRSTYAAVAEQSPTTLPPVTKGPLTGLADVGRRIRRGSDSGLGTHPLAGLDGAGGGATDRHPQGRYVRRSALPAATSGAGSVLTVLEAMRFYDRPGSEDPAGPDTVPPPPPRPDLEFHAFVAALADYPELLRHLGLALDFLVVDGDRIPEERGTVRFRVVDSPTDWVGREEARPLTHAERRERRFVARPREGEEEFADGALRVEDRRLFHLEQIDLDGAALKVAGAAATAVATREVVAATPGTEDVAASMTADEASLPALRGTGLTLYRIGRAQRLVGGWDAATGQEADRTAGTPPELWAEDVTRGYRLDVAERPAPDDWFSLHRREGSYGLRTDVPGERLPLPLAEPLRADEGYLKAASASHNAAEPDVAYVHEAVAGWEGWSLAAPRPGHRIGLTEVEDPADPAAEQPGLPLPLEAVFTPTRGSLPRLRYGRDYRVRARLVDMAGRSVPEPFVEPSHVTPFTTFFRWDPVPSPVVVPRRPFTEGESLLRMVIRSTLDVLPEAYVALPRITGLAGHTRADLAYAAENERHLVAPSGSAQLAELHGRFDDALRAGSSAADRDAAFALAARSEGSLLSPADGGMITDGQAPARPVDLPLDRFGRVIPHVNLLREGEYVLHDVDRLTLPYLPDPLSVGLSLATLPGDADPRILDWPSGGEWADRQPVRLQICDGSGPPRWDPAERLLRVFVPQAEHVQVQLSSVLPEDALPLMGVWLLEREPFRNAQHGDAIRGRHWMLTPWTTLDLVHAVEKPLAPPVLQVADPPAPSSAVHRFPGETFAALVGTVALHAKSTGRLDVEAEWTEPIDDVLDPSGPQVRPGQAHVGDFELGAAEDACRIGRRDIAPGPGRPATHRLRHEFGDTRHRWVNYTARATTRFREYFPPEITDRALGGDLTEHVGPPLRLNVPSSHRPDPPQVEYVVPTWTWSERSTIGARGRLGLGLDLRPTVVRTRSGGGLRVYLARPWFSSGEDELLGVVVRNQPWLTAPLDAAAGMTVSLTERADAELLAEQALGQGLVVGRGSARRSAAERLLAGASRAAVRPVEALARRTPQEQAQLTAHLAALDGVGLSEDAVAVQALDGVLASTLDALSALLGADGPLVSRWGTDPVWASEPTTSGPYIHQFALRSAVGSRISIPGQDEFATVVGHTPVFDPERGLWSCDLQVDAGAAYQPFLDLVLVRYQPYSVGGVHASTVVRAGFVSLLPERTAALTRLPSGSVAVSVRGPSGYNVLGQNFLFGSPPAAIVDVSREVTAVVQTRPVGADDIAWRAAGGEVRLHASGETLADIRWHATAPVPDVPAGSEARLVVSEYELFETDASQVETWVNRPAGGVGEAARKPAGRRLVFATEFAV